MNPIHSSLDNVDNIDLVKDYPFNEPIPFPYWSPCNLVKVTIHGDDFLRLARYFLPATENMSPYVPDHVRYYGCNPPMGDRRYELPGNLMTIEACTTSTLPPIPPLKLTSDGAPECSACRGTQQKRWVKLLSDIDDLWWASMIEPHYINGRFDEVEALIKEFFYAMLNRARVDNIMSILSAEWYDHEDINYWMKKIDVSEQSKFDRQMDILNSGDKWLIARLTGQPVIS